MKKYLPLLAFFLAMDAQACTLYRSTSSNTVVKLLAENGWNAKKFDAICPKLNRANAELLIDGQATVLGGASVGWAVLMLKDRDSNVTTSDYSSKSTSMNTGVASMDTAEALLYSALNSALDAYNVDDALVSLDDARRKTRAALAPKAGKK